MVVRWRPELCARSVETHEDAKIAKTARAKIHLRVLRPFVVIPTHSFYLAHRGPGGDDGQREKEERGRHLAQYSIRVKAGHRIANRLEYPDSPGADEDGEQNAGERSAGDQARAEQGACTQLGFFRLAGLALHPRADEAACENRRP